MTDFRLGSQGVKRMLKNMSVFQGKPHHFRTFFLWCLFPTPTEPTLQCAMENHICSMPYPTWTVCRNVAFLTIEWNREYYNCDKVVVYYTLIPLLPVGSNLNKRNAGDRHDAPSRDVWPWPDWYSFLVVYGMWIYKKYYLCDWGIHQAVDIWSTVQKF